MKIAILIGISNYDHLNQLPPCKNDVKLMEDLIRATSQYEKIFSISDYETSTNIRNSLLKLSKFLDDEISEVFFYYTGHGYFDNNEFYFSCSDSDPEKIMETFLNNSEIDFVLKSISPNVTVKVVDACNSGIPYIKSGEDSIKSGQFEKFLEKSKGRFDNCYFMFSSATDQCSIADENLSYFTRSFFNAIINHDSPQINYSHIMSFIPKEFSSTQQTPIFISQGSYNHEFCQITPEIRDLISSNVNSSSSIVSHTQSNNNEEILQLIQKVHDPKNSLSECIAEALKIGQNLGDKDLVKFCSNELTGWSSSNLRLPKNEDTNYRVIEYAVSPVEDISKRWMGNIVQMLDYMESKPDSYGKVEIFMTQPISDLEESIIDDDEEKLIHLNMDAKRIIPNYKGKNIKVHCYTRATVYKKLVQTIRTKLTKKLLNLSKTK